MTYVSKIGALALTMIAFASSTLGAFSEPEPGAELGPLISGTSSYVDGTYVWTDYAYDDRGANTNTLDGGDAIYPEGLSNSADIIQVQVGKTSNHISLLTLLQTLTDVTGPEIAFALDTDNDAGTGASALPGGAWPSSTSLGVEWLVIANSRSATLWHWNNSEWETVATLSARIDVKLNTISVELPLSVVDPGNAKWRAFALAGLADDSFINGGPIYDLAFVEGELITDRNTMVADSVQGAFVTGGTTMWQDHHQAAILAGEGATEESAAEIDFNKMITGVTELANAHETGWYTFLHKSRLVLAEGVTQGESAFGVGNAFTSRTYLGPYQPYMVLHRGNTNSTNNPLVVFLHGASQTHTQNTYWFDPPEAINTFDYPGITVFPLARGEVLGYAGISEFDVLEVIDDAIARLPINPDRIVLSGFSMGGMGTYKLASLYPDRFATAIAHFGTGSAVSDLMENLINLPFRADNGMLDYLVPAPNFLPDRERGLELGYDFRFFDVTNAHHALQPHLENCLYLNAIERNRVVNPPRVRYTVEPKRFVSDAETGLELHYNSAYWISNIQVRTGAVRGVVDATNLARADRVTATEVVDQSQAALGRDYCGPNPDVQPNPTVGDAWRERSIVHAPATQEDTPNAFKLEMSAVEAVTFDLTRMSLSNRQPLRIDITGDGETALTLLGDWRGLVEVSKDGEEQPGYTANPDGSLTVVDDFTGEHRYVLSSRSNTPSAGDGQAVRNR